MENQYQNTEVRNIYPCNLYFKALLNSVGYPSALLSHQEVLKKL